MKRTLLGLFVMGSLVGLGSVGVYFAQGKLAHTAPAAETEFQDIPDRTPKPIPVAKSDDSEPVAPSESGSPFISDSAPSTGAAATPYDDATQDVAAADRYQTYRSDDGADYSDDIPDAAPLPTADGAPATGDRYAEYDVQPTSAVEESTGAGTSRMPRRSPLSRAPVPSRRKAMSPSNRRPQVRATLNHRPPLKCPSKPRPARRRIALPTCRATSRGVCKRPMRSPRPTGTLRPRTAIRFARAATPSMVSRRIPTEIRRFKARPQRTVIRRTPIRAKSLPARLRWPAERCRSTRRKAPKALAGPAIRSSTGSRLRH